MIIKKYKIDKQAILKKINFKTYYQNAVSSLRVNGKSEAQGLCPFHDDNSPSLSINVNTGLWYCFTCGTGGNIFSFHKKLKQVDFKTALYELSREVELWAK